LELNNLLKIAITVLLLPAILDYTFTVFLKVGLLGVIFNYRAPLYSNLQIKTISSLGIRSDKCIEEVYMNIQHARKRKWIH